MQDSTPTTILNTTKQKLAAFIVLLSTLLLCITIAANVFIDGYRQYILNNDSNRTAPVGIVFGSGVTPDGKPYEELQARLDSAAEALRNGTVKKLILSGDNRNEYYNEPTAMLSYLINARQIDESLLQPDFAGRSTYETCERAAKVFEVTNAILFSATSHLPRALFTCRSFGIEAYGIGNSVEANNASRRELLARIKAIFNVYIYGEETILGEPIQL